MVSNASAEIPAGIFYVESNRRKNSFERLAGETIRGIYAIRLIYNNRQPTIDSGVTNAVKQVIVLDKDDQEAGRGIIQIPNVADQQGAHPLRNSSEIRIPLVAGPYSLILEDRFNIRRLLII